MGKNAYFELVTCQDGVYVEIIPPQEDGKLLAVTEITAYLDSHGLDKYDLKKIKEAAEQSEEKRKIRVGEPGSIAEDRNQVFVDLHCRHCPRVLTQILCHRADPRSDLKDKIILCHICRRNDLFEYMRIDQKVLSEFFLKIKMIFLQNLYRILRNPKCCHTFSFLILLYQA